MKLKINYKLLPIKAHFFLIFSALAPILPFLPVYAKQLGFDALGVGVIFAVLPFMGMIAKPVAGWIADNFFQQKLVFLISIVLTGIGYFCLQLVSKLDTDNSSQLHCSNPMSILKICRTEGALSSLIPSLPRDCPANCSLSCVLNYQSQICTAFSLADCKEDGTVHFTVSSNLSHHDSNPSKNCLLLPIDLAISENSSQTRPICLSKTSIECQADCQDESIHQFIREDSIFSSLDFWVFFLLNIISYSSFGVATSMGDALCFDLLEGKHEDYGAQRVWGSVGWGIFTVISGYLIDTQSSSEYKNYTPGFLLMGGLLVIDLIISSRMKLNSTGKSTSIFKDVMQLISSAKILVFVIWCTAVGIMTSIIWQWLLWYLQDLAYLMDNEEESCVKSQGPYWVTLLLGLNMGVQCWVGEVPMFFLSGWIIKTLGHTNTMTLVLGAFGVRFMLYSFITNPWFSLPIEILNGVTFGIFYSTMASYAHIIAPPGSESTMQGIVGAAFEGLGVAIGSFVGGAIYKNMGGIFMFRAFGFFALFLCILHAGVQLFLDRCATSQPSLRSDFKEVSTVDSGKLVSTQEILLSGGQNEVL